MAHEVFAPPAENVKILNVCIPLSVAFMTPFAMVRAERARFVTETPERF